MILVTLAIALALPPTLPIDQVEKGQRGECRTVFEGDHVEPFPFVVKGIMTGFLGPGRDLILVRLEGEKAEFTGVVAGMSGSPCTIDGRLVGALSYAFATFAKEPIGGITPIASMTDVRDVKSVKPPWRIPSASAADWDAFRSGAPVAPPVDAGPSPIATPLALGGVAPEIQKYFGPWLRSIGFEPTLGGTSGTGAKPQPLVPGSAVAAVLVSGDVDIAATGTVTAVEGPTVLAFGHPFMGTGTISIPMANATILNTMVSSIRSYKMSVTGAAIGEIVQDRLTAVQGHLGEIPNTIPVRGTISTGETEKTFSFQVARDPLLTPRFLAIAAASACMGRVEATSRGMIRFSGKIHVDGMSPITVRDVYAGDPDANLFVYGAVDMARYFSFLWDTPFGPPPQMSVDLSIVFEPQPIQEWIEAVHLDRRQARPGETVEIAVRLRRAQGGTYIERFRLDMPPPWAGQDIGILATGVAGAEKLEMRLGGVPLPTELRQIGQWISTRRSDGKLYLMVTRAGAGLHANVETLPFLPPSAVATISGGPNLDAKTKGIAWEENRARPGVVFGQAKASLRVLPR